jgi:hypothetical protein
MAGAWALSRAIAAAASWQMAAQSMSSAMQPAIIFTSSSCRQAAAQWLQAIAQSLQAAMQAAYLSWAMAFLLEKGQLGKQAPGFLSDTGLRTCPTAVAACPQAAAERARGHSTRTPHALRMPDPPASRWPPGFWFLRKEAVQPSGP